MTLPRWNSTARVFGLSALVLALMTTAESCAHSLKLPASGSGLHGWPRRGSRGNSETALAMSGAARLTAQGWAGAGVCDGPAATVGAGAGGAVCDGGTVACGVFDTVESLAPQPANAATAARIANHHFTLTPG